MYFSKNSLKRTLFFSSLMTSSLLFSCEGNEKYVSPTADTKTSFISSENSAKLANTNVDAFAIRLAKALKNGDFRNTLKAKALQKFDGDYNVLAKDLMETSVQGYGKAMNLINAQSGNTERIAALPANLNVAIPVHCEKWNTEAFSPLVVALDEKFDDQKTSKVKAYDSEGNIHWLSVKEEPSMPVVVVGRSERVDENGKLLGNFVDVNDGKNQRIYGYREYIDRIKCPDINSIEAWVLGAPELKLEVKALFPQFGNEKFVWSTGDSYFEPSKRNQVDNTWWSCNKPTFHWENWVGEYVSMHWWEFDGGTLYTVPITIIVKGVEIKTEIRIKNDDENLGYVVINHNDPTPRDYTLGGIYWTQSSRVQ